MTLSKATIGARLGSIIELIDIIVSQERRVTNPSSPLLNIMTINSMSQGTTEVVMESLSFVMDYTQDLLSSVSHLQISFSTSDQ